MEKEFLKKYGCNTLFEFVDVYMDFDKSLEILGDYFKLQQENEQLKNILKDFKEYVRNNGSMLKNPNIVDLLLKYNEIVFK